MIAAAVERLLFATAAMGTRFEIVIEARETAALRAVGELAIREIEELHTRLCVKVLFLELRPPLNISSNHRISEALKDGYRG